MATAWIPVEIRPSDGRTPITFDGTKRESHGASSVITKHPVGLGAKIADHMIDEGYTLKLDLLVSNTPAAQQVPTASTLQLQSSIGFGPVSVVTPSPVTAIVGAFPQPDLDFIAAKWAELDSLRMSGVLCEIDTSIRVYSNMALTNLDAPRQEIGMVIFGLRFEPMPTATTATAPAPAIPSAAPAVAAGQQATTPTGPGSSESVLSALGLGA